MAAKNTTVLIEETIQAVEHGSNIADINSQTMLNVVDGSNKVQKFINEIARASKEQSDAVSQITIGVDQISAVTQNNSATAEESAAASEELSSQAQLLETHIEKFRIEDNLNSNLHESTNAHNYNMGSTQNRIDKGSKY